MDTLPLAGLHIVVTRPQAQALPLQQRIEALGGKSIAFPLLEITPPVDAASLQAAVARLNKLDLLIFISPNAVHFGMEAILKAGGLPPGLRVATVGQGSAQALRDAGVAEVIAPQTQFDSETLLALPQLRDVRDWQVAIFRGDGGRELLGDTLKARGAAVEYVSCYQRGKPQQDVAMLLHGQVDALTLSSSEALTYLWDMLDTEGRKHLAALPLFVPHARIAALAQQQGWKKIIQTAGGDDGVVSGLLAWSAERSSG